MAFNNFDNFFSITGFDIQLYFTDFMTFIDVNEPKIYNYYAGSINRPDSSSFTELDRLLSVSDKLDEIILQYKDQFNDTSYWDLIDNIDNIHIKLLTIFNYSKWLRTTLTSDGYDTVQIDYIQKQNQTMEKVANSLGYSDPDNSWTNLAISNNMTEESYSADGGFMLKAYLKNDSKFFVNSVVDNIQGILINGKDIDVNFHFNEDDICVLAPTDTIVQSANTKMNMMKGSVPEFSNDGIDKAIIGSLNRASNMYPSLFRQLYNVFQKDDTFSSITLVNIKKNSGNTEVEFRITTRLGDTIPGSIVT